MTIRDELELLGPEMVRRAMMAFEPGHGYRCSIGTCCFMAHAAIQHDDPGERYEAHNSVTRMLGCVPASNQRPAVESNFENWETQPNYAGGREVLRQECIAFLAEHGNAPENRPASLCAHSRETVDVGECRFGRGE